MTDKRRPYLREQSPVWWLKDKRYTLYMLRDVSSFFILFFSLELIWGLFCLSQGRLAYKDFLEAIEHPVLLGLNITSFIFLMLHTITWFALSPEIMPMKIAGKNVPPFLIICGQYLGLGAASGFIFFLALRG